MTSPTSSGPTNCRHCHGAGVVDNPQYVGACHHCKGSGHCECEACQLVASRAECARLTAALAEATARAGEAERIAESRMNLAGSLAELVGRGNFDAAKRLAFQVREGLVGLGEKADMVAREQALNDKIRALGGGTTARKLTDEIASLQARLMEALAAPCPMCNAPDDRHPFAGRQ